MADLKHWSLGRWLWVGGMVLWLGVMVYWAVEAFTPHYRVSRATTFITGPLHKDGTVNYIAAINAMNSKGVTPENNAAVALLEILGSHALFCPPAERRDVLHSLGIQSTHLPARWIDFDQYLINTGYGTPVNLKKPQTGLDRMKLVYTLGAARGKEEDRYNSIHQPWTAVEHPLIARWLKSQGHAIALAQRAALLPRFYAPVIPWRQTGLVNDSLSLGEIKNLWNVLQIDALERLGNNDSAGCWQDILTIHRLAKLLEQGRPDLIRWLVAASGQYMADNLTVILATRGHTSAERLLRYLAVLRQQKRVGGFAGVMNWGERLVGLNMIQRAYQIQNKIVRNRDGFRGFIPLQFGQAMARYNKWINRFVVALRPKAYAARLHAVTAVTDSILAARPHGWWGVYKHFNSLENMLAVMTPDFSLILPLEYKGRAHQILARTALALAAYRARHNTYPSALAQLVPHYFPTVPVDPFTHHLLYFFTHKNGYLLYSVGPNMRDDRGRHARMSYPPNPNAPDDIAVRVHWAKNRPAPQR